MNKVESSGFIFIAEEKIYTQEKISEEIASVIRKIEKESEQCNKLYYSMVLHNILYPII